MAYQYGSLLVTNYDGIQHLRIYTEKNLYEMQLCYFDPIMKKFSLRFNNRMNPDFDYLERLEQIEQIMLSKSNSVIEMKLKEENEKLKAIIYDMKHEIESLRKAIVDSKVIKDPIIFDAI